MIVLRAVLAIAGTAALVSLAVYIYLAPKASSLAIYGAADTRLLSSKDRAFLILALIGLLICMYCGAKALLFWLPQSWMIANADSDPEPVVDAIAGMFAFFGGLSLAQFIDQAAREKFYSQEMRDRIGGLEEIVAAANDPTHLQVLRTKYENQIE